MDAGFIGKMSIGAKRHIPQIIKLCFVCRAASPSKIAFSSWYFPPLIYMATGV